MTQIVPEFKKCSVCGASSMYDVVISSNKFGSPDLDLRPPQMERDTMSYWVEECPNCGYVSSEITDPCSVAVSYLKSDEYRTCDGLSFKSGLASRFYKYYKINLLSNDTKTAFYAVLHAAWACDDKRDIQNSKICRERALSLISHLIESDHQRKDTLRLMKADLLRRAGHFDELMTEYENVRFDEEIMNQVLAFQLALARKQDTACYTVAAAVSANL